MKKRPLGMQISSAGKRIQYDNYVRKTVGHKTIMKFILKDTVDEFSEMPMQKILACIDGTPEILVEESDSDLLIEELERKVEEQIFDIHFRTIHLKKMKKNNKYIKVKMLFDIEIQKKYYPGYKIITRGVFYGARELTRQYGTEFANSDYDGLRKVYSIWICMNSSKRDANKISKFYLEKKDLEGQLQMDKESYDKMVLVMITLNDKMETDHPLLQMLNILLSPNISYEEKEKQLREKFGILLEYDLEEDVRNMCNLSEYVWETGIKTGMKRGVKKGVKRGVKKGVMKNILSMIIIKYKKGLSIEQIAEQIEEPEAYVRKIYEIVEKNAPDFNMGKMMGPALAVSR